MKSLVLSNTGSSVNEIFRGMTQLRLDLGADVCTRMLMHEGRGDVESDEYEVLVKQLYARHLRRSTPFEIDRPLREFEEIISRSWMWGRRTSRCGARTSSSSPARWPTGTSPTVSGRSPSRRSSCVAGDEVDLRCHRILADGILDNEFVIFGNSSHVTILEKEGDSYLAVIGDFVRRASAAAG